MKDWRTNYRNDTRTDEHVVLDGELDEARHERVLRRAVDVGHPLKDGRRRVQGAGRHLRLAALDGRQQRLCRVVQPLHHLRGRQATGILGCISLVFLITTEHMTLLAQLSIKATQNEHDASTYAAWKQ